MGTIIEHPTDLHLQKVWSKLDRLVIGQILEVKKEAPRFPELWIQCVKMYIDCFNGLIEFNSDYSKLRRMQGLIFEEVELNDLIGEFKI